MYTVCPGGSDPFYIVAYYIKWVPTSWTYSTSGLMLYFETLVDVTSDLL